MEIFTAKQFHESPREVYKAAMKGAVKVTHSHLGESFILKVDDGSFEVKGGLDFSTKVDLSAHDKITSGQIVTLDGIKHNVSDGVIHQTVITGEIK